MAGARTWLVSEVVGTDSRVFEALISEHANGMPAAENVTRNALIVVEQHVEREECARPDGFLPCGHLISLRWLAAGSPNVVALGRGDYARTPGTKDLQT